MDKQKFLNSKRLRRRRHVRNKLRGDAERPRLNICRSHKHIRCQVIDDVSGKTLVVAASDEKEVRDKLAYGGNRDAAKMMGQLLAERALQAGIKQVRFDRGHYRYHGRVAAVADAAREAGLGL